MSSNSSSPQLKFQTFLTHDWGKKQVNGITIDNHARVSRIYKGLKHKNITAWFDEVEMLGNIDDKMSRGIDDSFCVCVFITERYLEKVGGDNANDNCKKEFQYSTARKGPQLMLPIVMEESCRDQSKWSGMVGLNLNKALYVDFASPNVWSDDAVFNKKIDELCQFLVRIGINQVQQ